MTSNPTKMGVLTALGCNLIVRAALAGTPPAAPPVPEPKSLLLFAVDGSAAAVAAA